MNILVIGNGGRENAIVWKLAQSPSVENLYIAPGNPGCGENAQCIDLDPADKPKVVDFCKKHKVDLVVIGPEIPLVNGLGDDLRAANIFVFGPSKAAAQIEGSKVFSKDLMEKYKIPTASYKSFTNSEEAKAYAKELGIPLVIKADGLAAGKGVIIPETMDEALEAIENIMNNAQFGTAGDQLVIEEFMEGEEVSVLCFTDGKEIVPMLPVQDHKRIFDGDKGLNTGGMGTYAPAPLMNDSLLAKIKEQILYPVVDAMNKENCPFIGCLYAGLMVDKMNNPKVVEFNARFGDPETQVLMPLLDGDLAEIMMACAQGKLQKDAIKWQDGAAVCVVMASGGYPEHYDTGYEITIDSPKLDKDTIVFHAGTKLKDGKLVTAGGRVLNVVSLDNNLKNAIDKVYKNIKYIDFDKAFYRKDIAHKGLARLKML